MQFLRNMLANKLPLLARKKLRFWVKEISVDEPRLILWKVLNRGEQARNRNCIRGQIIADDGNLEKTENANFKGDHVVECYCVKDGIVVAKDRIHVPIATNQEDQNDE